MEKRIKIKNKEYIYKLKRRSRVKYVRLAIESDGSIVITAPKLYPLFLIRTYIIQQFDWTKENIKKREDSNSILSIKHSKKEIKEYSERTRVLVLNKLECYTQIYSVEYNRISIRNQKTRWGSCSSKKNLNFNYRLCLLPPSLSNYIIVHELCHLIELNHSSNFWNLVSKEIPDFKEKKKQLKNI